MVIDERHFQHFPVQHFCPIARTLEVLGERWSFLIVRDLLRGPQRFSDLQRFLVGITPKRLTIRLRALEAAGILVREEAQGRREVWYHLTPKGRELRPVIEALAGWGLDHAMIAPSPQLNYYPEQLMPAFRGFLRRRAAPPAPVLWAIDFVAGPSYAVCHDGEGWAVTPDDAPGATVRIATKPIALAGLLAAPRDDRAGALDALTFSGDERQIAVLRELLGGA